MGSRMRVRDRATGVWLTLASNLRRPTRPRYHVEVTEAAPVDRHPRPIRDLASRDDRTVQVDALADILAAIRLGEAIIAQAERSTVASRSASVIADTRPRAALSAP